MKLHLHKDIISLNTTRTELNDQEVCDRTIAMLSENYTAYFAPVILSGKVTCVNQCHQSHPHPKKCMNEGTCQVSSQGPFCYCLHTDVNWYFGEDCNQQVHKVGLYAGLAAVALIAVVTVAVLAIYLSINKRKVKKNKDIKLELVNEWLEDDFEWPPQKSTSYSGAN
ncbi:mucin-3B-like [Xyrauchen texanus]|uniref:mucin-3B-like n=1 Tax=Xyrauchen texanus TaxID=154827 RepID=UPI002241FF36|nr:mucin-3B-like [Xyrauchen texanus]